jgi:hydrogenase nickel incorporation protein HypA/HybF
MNESPSPQTILDQALRRARDTGRDRVAEVRVALGDLIPIRDETFRADWSSLSRVTIMAGAVLHIRRVPAEFQCMACFTRYQPKNPQPVCPSCGSVGAKILSGEEFTLEEIR